MKTTFLSIAFLLSSAGVQAMPIYTFSTDDLGADLLNQSPVGGANSRGGNVTEVDVSFDSGKNLFNWNYTTGPGRKSAENDGFWLVMAPTPSVHNKTNTPFYLVTYSQAVWLPINIMARTTLAAM